MKKKTPKRRDSDLRHEYDRAILGQGVRGKYAQRVASGTNLILLSPEISAYFPTQESVESALRSVIAAHRRTKPKARR